MEALVAIKWDKEREGQVCEKATEDLQNPFCLFLFVWLIAIHLVSLFWESESKFVSTLSVRLFPYSVLDKGGEPKVLEDMFDYCSEIKVEKEN